jgi:hypothetical protein
MTAQISEKMIFEGNAYNMANAPLRSVLSRKKNRHLRLMPKSTACRRGYVGYWEIVEDRLFLKSFNAKLIDGTPFGMGDLFPDEPQPVFAQWYTGVLTLPYGEELKYVHSGFESIYEFSMHLKIENGRVVDKVVQKNEAPPPDELNDLDEDLY